MDSRDATAPRFRKLESPRSHGGVYAATRAVNCGHAKDKRRALLISHCILRQQPQALPRGLRCWSRGFVHFANTSVDPGGREIRNVLGTSSEACYEARRRLVKCAFCAERGNRQQHASAVGGDIGQGVPVNLETEHIDPPVPEFRQVFWRSSGGRDLPASIRQQRGNAFAREPGP